MPAAAGTRASALALLSLLGGCGPRDGGHNAQLAAVGNARTAMRPTVDQPVLVPATPASTPARVVDPRSGEAARDALRQLASAVQAGRPEPALALLTPPLRARLAREGGAARVLARYRDLRADFGSPSTPEGAAGSSYVTVPVRLRFTERGRPGEAFGSATLRRVNDVPGATEDQLRWRVDDFVLGMGGPRTGGRR